eukprot:1160701-Pelagomonas_calceolata.AAC.2
MMHSQWRGWGCVSSPTRRKEHEDAVQRQKTGTPTAELNNSLVKTGVRQIKFPDCPVETRSKMLAWDMEVDVAHVDALNLTRGTNTMQRHVGALSLMHGTNVMQHHVGALSLMRGTNVMQHHVDALNLTRDTNTM